MSKTPENSISGSASKKLKKTKMSTIGIVSMVFAFVCAGPFGMEEIIPASGPGMTIVLMVIFPFVWATPLSEFVSEMGSLAPSEGGIYTWARFSMGEFWGWITGAWAGLITWLCQAQYCAIIVGYIAKVVELDATTTYILKIVVVVVFTLINIIGLHILEKLETICLVIIVCAFAFISIIGFTHWQHNPMMPFYNPEIGLGRSAGASIGLVIWMYIGYECMSAMAGEAENPKVIPKGVRLANPVVAAVYIIPTIACLGALGHWQEWTVDGEGGGIGWGEVLIQYIGPWAGVAFAVIAIIANSSILMSYMAHGARAFFVMSDDNMFPKWMCKVDRRGVPTVALIALAIFTVITCTFNFAMLVMITTPIQLYLYTMMILSLIRLRKMYPAEERKKKGLYVIAGKNVGYMIMVVMVLAISAWAIVVNGTEYFFIGTFVLLGTVAAYILVKLLYKGRYLDNPELYPLNKKTGLGVGDGIEIGKYLIGAGVLTVVGGIGLWLYDRTEGPAYYLEEYETGIFSNYWMMLGIILGVGAITLIAGLICYFCGKKAEGAAVKALRPAQRMETDKAIAALHPELDLTDMFQAGLENCGLADRATVPERPIASEEDS